MQHLIEQTKSLLNRQAKQLAGRPILAAVSGGPDSTVLALVCANLAKAERLPGPLCLAHLDHRQHAASQKICAQVERLAGALQVDFDHDRLDLPCDTDELSMREARYQGLIDIARRRGAGLVLTAHHADDDLETILFRLLRGTGLRGLCGIPAQRMLADGIVLARPFLTTRKRYLQAALDESGVECWHDPGNMDLKRSRNFLRHSLIPDLRAKIGTRLDVSLVAIARSAKAVDELISDHANLILEKRGQAITPWRYEIKLAGMTADHQPFLGEALRQLHVDMSGIAPSSHWLDRAQGMLSAATGRRLMAGGGLLCERTKEGLLVLDLSRCGEPPLEPLVLHPSLQPLRFGSTEWRMSAQRLQTAPLDPSPRKCGSYRVLLDARSIRGEMTLRSRRPTDRFWPLGAKSEVGLKKFLQGRHVPRFDRDRMPLLLDQTGHILWTPGVEISERAKLRPQGGPCIEVVAERVG